MKNRRLLLACLLVAVATLLLIAIASAPGLGPPFDRAIVESLFWSAIGIPFLVPVFTLILVLLCRFVPIRPPAILAIWLIGWGALAAWSWITIDPKSDFQTFVSAADLPSLNILQREQWTSYSDGSTWVFEFRLSDQDRQRLIDDLKLELAAPEWVDPRDAIEPREGHLRDWPPYHRPANGRYWHGTLSTMVEDIDRHTLYLLRSPEPRRS